MSNERPMFPPSALRVVGGIDFSPATETGVPAVQGRAKRCSPDEGAKHNKYQKRLPVIDPEGEEDGIFREIARHRASRRPL